MSWTHLGDTTPKARKRHQCYLCCGWIEPGEKHVQRSGVNGSLFSSIRMHVECERETDSWDEMDWESFSTGGMRRPSLNGRAKP